MFKDTGFYRNKLFPSYPLKNLKEDKEPSLTNILAAASQSFLHIPEVQKYAQGNVLEDPCLNRRSQKLNLFVTESS
jgi:hypothetical protein